MFTNNVRDLPVGEGQRTAMCDVKGRLVGLFDLYLPAEGRVVAVLEGVPPEEFETRYEKYVVFDDVEIVHRDWAVRTLQGPKAREILQAAGLPVPELAWAEADGIVVVRKARAGEGFDLLAAPDGIEAVVSRLIAAGATAATAEELEVARVERGKVRWPHDMPGRSLVFELGLRDEVCHFEKGCYVGQEIIHRLDVMGKTRKRLVGLSAKEAIPAGELKLGDDAVGVCTSPVISAEHGAIALAVVRMPSDSAGTVLDAGGVAVTVHELPFAGSDAG